MKTPNGGNLHILQVPIPVSYLSTLNWGPFPLVNEIISRCPIDQTQVASESAIATSRFKSASRTCRINSSKALWTCLKITMDLRGIEPTSGFRFKFASPDWNTGVPQSFIFSLIMFFIRLFQKSFQILTRIFLIDWLEFLEF